MVATRWRRWFQFCGSENNRLLDPVPFLRSVDINVYLSPCKHIKLLLHINKVCFTCDLMSLQRHNWCKSRVQCWMDLSCGTEHDPNNDQSWSEKQQFIIDSRTRKGRNDSSTEVHFPFHHVIIFLVFSKSKSNHSIISRPNYSLQTTFLRKKKNPKESKSGTIKMIS